MSYGRATYVDKSTRSAKDALFHDIPDQRSIRSVPRSARSLEPDLDNDYPTKIQYSIVSADDTNTSEYKDSYAYYVPVDRLIPDEPIIPPPPVIEEEPELPQRRLRRGHSEMVTSEPVQTSESAILLKETPEEKVKEKKKPKAVKSVKPPFANYGSRNVTPLSSANHMASYNINPLLHKSTQKETSIIARTAKRVFDSAVVRLVNGHHVYATKTNLGKSRRASSVPRRSLSVGTGTDSAAHFDALDTTLTSRSSRRGSVIEATTEASRRQSVQSGLGAMAARELLPGGLLAPDHEVMVSDCYLHPDPPPHLQGVYLRDVSTQRTPILLEEAALNLPSAAADLPRLFEVSRGFRLLTGAQTAPQRSLPTDKFAFASSRIFKKDNSTEPPIPAEEPMEKSKSERHRNEVETVSLDHVVVHGPSTPTAAPVTSPKSKLSENRFVRRGGVLVDTLLDPLAAYSAKRGLGSSKDMSPRSPSAGFRQWDALRAGEPWSASPDAVEKYRRSLSSSSAVLSRRRGSVNPPPIPASRNQTPKRPFSSSSSRSSDKKAQLEALEKGFNTRPSISRKTDASSLWSGERPFRQVSQDLTAKPVSENVPASTTLSNNENNQREILRNNALRRASIGLPPVSAAERNRTKLGLPERSMTPRPYVPADSLAVSSNAYEVENNQKKKYMMKASRTDGSIYGAQLTGRAEVRAQIRAAEMRRVDAERTYRDSVILARKIAREHQLDRNDDDLLDEEAEERLQQAQRTALEAQMRMEDAQEAIAMGVSLLERGIVAAETAPKIVSVGGVEAMPELPYDLAALPTIRAASDVTRLWKNDGSVATIHENDRSFSETSKSRKSPLRVTKSQYVDPGVAAPIPPMPLKEWLHIEPEYERSFPPSSSGLNENFSKKENTNIVSDRLPESIESSNIEQKAPRRLSFDNTQKFREIRRMSNPHVQTVNDTNEGLPTVHNPLHGSSTASSSSSGLNSLSIAERTANSSLPSTRNIISSFNDSVISEGIMHSNHGRTSSTEPPIDARPRAGLLSRLSRAAQLNYVRNNSGQLASLLCDSQTDSAKFATATEVQLQQYCVADELRQRERYLQQEEASEREIIRQIQEGRGHHMALSSEEGRTDSVSSLLQAQFSTQDPDAILPNAHETQRYVPEKISGNNRVVTSVIPLSELPGAPQLPNSRREKAFFRAFPNPTGAVESLLHVDGKTAKAVGIPFTSVKIGGTNVEAIPVEPPQPPLRTVKSILKHTTSGTTSDLGHIRSLSAGYHRGLVPVLTSTNSASSFDRDRETKTHDALDAEPERSLRRHLRRSLLTGRLDEVDSATGLFLHDSVAERLTNKDRKRATSAPQKRTPLGVGYAEAVEVQSTGSHANKSILADVVAFPAAGLPSNHRLYVSGQLAASLRSRSSKEEAHANSSSTSKE